MSSRIKPSRLPAQLDDDEIGREAGLSQQDHQSVRLWLRLLACSTQIEQIIRTRLRVQFRTTLARFDYLAQVSRFPQGLRMKALSSYLMVTGGNITGLTDQLVAEGWIERVDDPQDRRAMIIRLTSKGKSEFRQMAAEHEQWLEELLGKLSNQDSHQLYQMLGKLRVALTQSVTDRSGHA